ncbi:hypothetical protein [Acinetobacter calcoaceticus]|uniref:hypothetical protein n=1 Tax=Acinetobacter calcoaceticus TaxID=471 RepID=UPI003A8A2C89
MTLDLSKIKSEANQDREAEIRAAENEQKIKKGVIKHREDIKEWFISLFEGENIDLRSNMETSVLFHGGTEIGLFFNLIEKSQSGVMVQNTDRADFYFQKIKNGKPIVRVTFTDLTKYLELDQDSKAYEYELSNPDQRVNVKFSELEKLLQYVVDK